jgi:mannosyltransferase OCH1-like enzyme
MAKKIIPRRIFYCWFGDMPKPPQILECLGSWKKYMPTWEIVEINENNFPLSEYSFAQEAYNRKRYAFVTDVARLWCLEKYGGVYMDSDVLVTKPLDRFLEHSAFTGHETNNLTVTAVMGSVANHSWVNLLLSYYNGKEYSEHTNTNIISQINKTLLERENEYGYKYLKDGVVIYPVSHFCSFDHQKLEIVPHTDAYAYHLFLGSWTTREGQLNGRGLEKLHR